jgi:hypothetical protein
MNREGREAGQGGKDDLRNAQTHETKLYASGKPLQDN